MSKTPHAITVVVDEDSYEMFGDISTPLKTWKTITLTKILRGEGGVSDTVPPGIYDFYVTRKGLKLTAHLEPQVS